MTNGTTTPNHQFPVEIAHAVSGRLRLRLAGGDRTRERLDALAADLDALRGRPGIHAVELKRAARAVVIRYEPNLLDQDAVLALAAASGLVRGTTATYTPESAGASPERSETTEELAALIGIPTSFDRRLAESLALSGVSLLAARQVGLVLGGSTLPAYFAIWFALRRLTGLGRRR
ncbi:MAG: hypothetical protein M3O34_08370 [Chloroflexota bacterium]|nr:hypothetical protein [Chloroflexota bacterium]